MRDREKRFIEQEGTVFPGKTYAEQLLAPVFRDQRDYFYQEMVFVQRAHVLMLFEEGIVERSQARQMLSALEQVACLDPLAIMYDPQHEDLFFLLEHRMEQMIGSDAAGNMHIAKSRNDMGVTMYRLSLRGRLLELLEQLLVLRESVLWSAEDHKGTIMPAYTHTQPAQPTTLGHYLLAVYDMLERDTSRIVAAFDAVNLSPLGAAALTTTGFPINRHRTAELLGFAGLVENSYDAIAGADYLLQASAAVLTLMTHTGRFTQDLLLQATKEFGGIAVADPYVQISSIMPQKRNPVSLEHARALASSAYGEAFTVFHMVHNTPFGDIVDTEDDLQPHLCRSISQALRVIKLLDAVVRTMAVNREHLAQRASCHGMTITELADVLTREKGISFRKAHQMAGTIARTCAEEKMELHDLPAAEVNALLGGDLLTETEWRDITSPVVFIARRSVQGGPNVKEVERMIEKRKEMLRLSQEMVRNRRSGISTAAALQQKLIQNILSP